LAAKHYVCSRDHASLPRYTLGACYGKRSSTIEDRLRAIEDRLEIYNLIASHPPSADTGVDYCTRVAYVDDGDRSWPRPAISGNEAIAAITKTAAHQAAIAGGLAHFAGLPRIELDGDSATVASYLQIFDTASDGRTAGSTQPRYVDWLSHSPRRGKPLGARANR
jgi:hypothetical protein